MYLLSMIYSPYIWSFLRVWPSSQWRGLRVMRSQVQIPTGSKYIRWFLPICSSLGRYSYSVCAVGGRFAEVPCEISQGVWAPWLYKIFLVIVILKSSWPFYFVVFHSRWGRPGSWEGVILCYCIFGCFLCFTTKILVWICIDILIANLY